RRWSVTGLASRCLGHLGGGQRRVIFQGLPLSLRSVTDTPIQVIRVAVRFDSGPRVAALCPAPRPVHHAPTSRCPLLQCSGETALTITRIHSDARKAKPN